MAKRKLYYYWEWPFPQGTPLWIFGIDIINRRFWYGWEDSNLQIFDPKSNAYANSATPTYMGAQTRISTENHSLTMSF